MDPLVHWRYSQTLFAVSTGFLTTICAMASLLSVRPLLRANLDVPLTFLRSRFGDRHSSMWHFILVLEDVCFALTWSGLSLIASDTVYSNSVLATLNARQAIRELGEDSENLSFSLQPTFLKSGPGGFNSNVCPSVSQPNAHL